MITKLVKIGNSKGIILSKSLIKHAQLEKEVFRSVKSGARKNWDKKFRNARKRDKLLLGSWYNNFDRSEWKWK